MHVRDQVLARENEIRNSIPSGEVPLFSPAYLLKHYGENQMSELRQTAERSNLDLQDAQREIAKGEAYGDDDEAFLDA